MVLDDAKRMLFVRMLSVMNVVYECARYIRPFC